MNAFTIKDVENLSGIQAHTLRIWEQRYDFLKPQRSTTNIRYYTNDELKTILNVALLNRFGYRISRISKMSAAEIADKILNLLPGEARFQHIINQLLEQMIDMELDNFDTYLSKLIQQFGLKQSFIDVVFPFLERIGMLWSTGRVNAAQEHFVSNIIRQKLLAETETLPVPQDSKYRVLLFLPEGEMHELGILFVQYLVKQQRQQNWYLGANVPLEDVAYVIQAKQPSYLYTHLTAVTQSFNLEKFVGQVSELVTETKVLISGPVTAGYDKALPTNVHLYKTSKQIQEFINSLQ